MNKIATTILVSSLALGGLAIASDSNEYKEHEKYEKHENYEKHGKHGKYCNKRGKKSGARIERMIERLDLNENQAKQVRNIRDSYRPKMESFRNKMKESRQELREAMHAETIDQNKVKELAQKKGNLMAEKIVLRAEMRNEINKVLTKKQREEMKEMKGRHGYGYERRS